MSQKYYYVEFYGSLAAADKRHTFKSLIESDYEFVELATKNSGVDYYLPASAPTRAPIGVGEYKVHNATPTCNTADPTSVVVTFEVRDMTEDEINKRLKKEIVAKYKEKINAGIQIVPRANEEPKTFSLDDDAVQRATALLSLLASGQTIGAGDRFFIATCDTKCQVSAGKLLSIGKKIVNYSFLLQQKRDDHLNAVNKKTEAVKAAAAGAPKTAALTALKSYSSTIDSSWPSA